LQGRVRQGVPRVDIISTKLKIKSSKSTSTSWVDDEVHDERRKVRQMGRRRRTQATWRLEETTPREIHNRCQEALARCGDLADRERKLWPWRGAKDRAAGHGQAGKDGVAVMGMTVGRKQGGCRQGSSTGDLRYGNHQIAASTRLSDHGEKSEGR
jgi:hypothetical protein